MDEVLYIDKPLGLSSFDVIRKLKSKFKGGKIGHAGTLDPLAEGLLICLVGKNATKRQDEFMGVDKTYEFETLFGFSTDTYDILGLVENFAKYDVNIDISDATTKFQGKYIQGVPPFSAVKINGKPLYRWYLSGQINQVEIPKKEVDIINLHRNFEYKMSKELLKDKIFNLVDKVDSGFRKQMVLDRWNEVFENSQLNSDFLVANCTAQVSKGTYIRSLANDISSYLNIPGCTIKIRRIQIGNYSINDVNFDLQKMDFISQSDQ